jgi:hypothetical protein
MKKKPVQQRITVTLNGAGKKKGGAKGKAAPSKKNGAAKKKVNKRR